jgi:DNA modification methylase
VTPEVRLLHGDAAEMLRGLPAASVHCVVTSPPYLGLRSYLPKGHPDKPKEIGLEESPTAYVTRLLGVFREVWRVLAPDGVLFVNVGDGYAGTKAGNTNGGPSSGLKRDGRAEASRQNANDRLSKQMSEMTFLKHLPGGLVAKNLLGLPWRLAFALQEDGWVLRVDVIIAKRAPMPESVTDRPTRAHEYLFLFAKRQRYFWDAEAVAEPVSGNAHARGEGLHPKALQGTQGQERVNPSFSRAVRGLVERRNCRSVWEIGCCPSPEPHFAIMPREVVARCILAGTSAHGHCPRCGAGWRRVTVKGPAVKGPNGPGTAKKLRECQGPHGATSVLNTGVYYPKEPVGWQPGCKHGDLPVVPAVVLDPFSGSGTTLLVALGHGRHAVGIDLNREYLEMTRRRLGLFAPAEETP